MGILQELIRTKSIIAAQINLFWPESIWEQLDAKGKYENTLNAVKNFFLAQSLLKPVIIELEDGHWIDSDTLALLKVLTRNIADYPILLISTLRYNDDGTKRKFELENANTLEIDLNYLSAEDVKNCAEIELEGPISDELYTSLLEKTNGNPFFVQQLIRYFIEHDLLTRKDETWHVKSDTLKLPDTIHAVLIARIDRLSEKVKEVVKTAAVIGREFDIVLLSAILKKDVLSQVQIVRKARIWEELQELLYIFKHALLRDAAYQMQLKERLRELHQLTAETMETLYATHPEKRYADLAYHYEKAEINDKAVEYLEKAADDNKAHYHNQQALDLYDRLLSQVRSVFGPAGVEFDIFLKEAEILELTGEWKECQQVCEEALQLSEAIGDKRRMGQAERILGRIFRQAGKHDESMASFERAVKMFEAMNEKAGIGRIFTDIGISYRRKGSYDVAMTWYKKSLLLNEEVGDAPGVIKNANNMGIAHFKKGNYDSAMTWYNKSLQISEKLGEKLERSRVLNNIGECLRAQGHYERAMIHYKQALAIHEELGEKISIAIALGNIGLVYTAEDRYDMAIASYDRAIMIGRELESKFYLCSSLIDKANTLFLLQHYKEAREFNAEGLQMAEEIDDEEYIFKGRVLSAKITFALGNKEAPRYFKEMILQTQDDTEIAALHYEFWKMTCNEEHKQIALNLYQTLYATTPNIEYKTRMEEMENYKDLI